MERDVVRCANARCRLNQFRTANGNCRKCREVLPAKEVPEIKIEVVQPAPTPPEPVKAEPFIPGPTYRRPRGIQPRNREPKEKKPPKQKPLPKKTAMSCYEEFRRAGTAKERREIIMRYLNA